MNAPALAMDGARTPVAEHAARVIADHVGHRYGTRRGLLPVSFDIAGPGVAAITGRNGSGKSTLLRILAGLQRASEGAASMHVAGAPVPPRERRRVVGFASPELHFYDELSVAENLRFAARARGRSAPDADRIVGAALAEASLQDEHALAVSALSSGMKQRMRIAYAGLFAPPVLLLDEAASFLDPTWRAWYDARIRDWGRSRLVVLATNDPEEWALAERRIELDGRG